jgi:hypothetical protein
MGARNWLLKTQYWTYVRTEVVCQLCTDNLNEPYNSFPSGKHQATECTYKWMKGFNPFHYSAASPYDLWALVSDLHAWPTVTLQRCVGRGMALLIASDAQTGNNISIRSRK